MAREPGIVLHFPTEATDHDFLKAVEGYIRCLNPGQEAHLSPEQLQRLVRIGRRAVPP